MSFKDAERRAKEVRFGVVGEIVDTGVADEVGVGVSVPPLLFGLPRSEPADFGKKWYCEIDAAEFMEVATEDLRGGLGLDGRCLKGGGGALRVEGKFFVKGDDEIGLIEDPTIWEEGLA
jgi:hypothetical protein